MLARSKFLSINLSDAEGVNGEAHVPVELGFCLLTFYYLGVNSAYC